MQQEERGDETEGEGQTDRQTDSAAGRVYQYTHDAPANDRRRRKYEFSWHYH